MYVPQHFEENDPAVLHALMRAHPFGAWIMAVDGELIANHLPFLLDTGSGGHGVLKGHIARANPAWRALQAGLPSMVIFQGPDTYITPSWYASKAEHGKVVPTWNYAVVHAHGEARAIEDREWLLALLGELTARHEARRTAPWHLSDAPPSYVDGLLNAIVGIELPVTKLVGKWKTSQNRTPEDRRSVIAGLQDRGDAAAHDMAALVRRHTPDEAAPNSPSDA